jgi:Fur family peroxide stress response transcriptional regulator
MDREFLSKKLHENKKRITPQREAVYLTLLKMKNHPSAEEIHKQLLNKYPNISLATIYQILNLFENELGIIKSITVEQTKHYELDSKFHIHIICTNCDKIVDIYSEKIKDFWEKVISNLNIHPEDQIIKIYQKCERCAKR